MMIYSQSFIIVFTIDAHSYKPFLPSSFQPQFKIWGLVILIRNMIPSEGLLNGTRRIIQAIPPQNLKFKIKMGLFSGNINAMPRIALIS